MKWIKAFAALVIALLAFNYQRMSSKLKKNDKIISDLNGQVTEEKWKNDLSEKVIESKSDVITDEHTSVERMQQYGWSVTKGKTK